MMQGTVRGSDGATIAYETLGDGPPLLLIAGFAATRVIWQPQLGDWARHRELILIDNRNVGQSRGPGLIPWIGLMAGDCLAVLDGLGVTQADVCGMSMGGFIAQTLALRHPDRIRRLVLTCTAPCRPVPRPGGGLLGMFFAPDFAAANPETIDYWRKVGPGASSGVMLRQLAACAAYDLRRELPSLALPVLVAHGSADRVIPVHNGRWLAKHIPGAQLIVYAGAGHAMSIERTADYNRDVMEFLAPG